MSKEEEELLEPEEALAEAEPAEDALDAAGEPAGDAPRRPRKKKAETKVDLWMANAEETLSGLERQYGKYRAYMIGLAVLTGADLLAGMGLYYAQVIDEDTQLGVFMGSWLFVFLMLVLAFGKVNPLKTDMKRWRGYYEEMLEASPSAQKRMVGKLPKYSESLKKEMNTPPYPGFKRTRVLWIALNVAAVALMLGAMLFIRMHPDQMVVAMVILTAAFVPMGIALWLERTRLKPMRTQWQHEYERRKLRKA